MTLIRGWALTKRNANLPFGSRWISENVLLISNLEMVCFAKSPLNYSFANGDAIKYVLI